MTPGTKLGRYTLIRRLGVGGMGEVYLAESQGAANVIKQVAIKRILPHLARKEESVAKFIDEAQIMVQLHHGNIVPVIELADEGGELFLVTEYVPGRDLKTVLRKMRSSDVSIPADLAVLLIRQVCAGLDYAHRKCGSDGISLGIVHRDISPSNIVIGAGGEVKLIDFGIARGRGLLHQSISGTLQGKFIYMSPEQADGRTLDSRSDIFSAGLVLYELLTGVRPFEGRSETDTLRLVRLGAIPDVRQYRPELEPALAEITMKALAKDVDARYQTADEFGRAISHFLALTESSAGALQVTEFLEVLFPDGVIPSGEDRPQSLDDALNMQLNALTPNPGHMEVTRTNTGPLPARLSTSPQNVSRDASSNQFDALSVTADPPVSHITVVEPAKGRKRMLFLGLTLGVIASLGSVFWAESPLGGTLSVQINPVDAANQRVTVDDVPLKVGEKLRAGRTYRVCVAADGFQTHCERKKLSVGENLATVELQPLPILNPDVIPKDLQVRILVDRVEATELPMRLEIDRTYTVCAEAKGFVSDPPCHRIKTKTGVYRPRFHFTPQAEMAPRPEVPSASTGGVPKAKPKPKSTSRVNLRSIPIAEVWSKGKKLGLTPFPIKVGPRTRALTLRAKGYAPTKVALKPGQRGDVTVPLSSYAYLTLRVHPPASEIWLDGQRVAEGVLNRRPTEPGRHDLEVRYYRAGELVGKVKRQLQLIEGKTHRLPTITVHPKQGSAGSED